MLQAEFDALVRNKTIYLVKVTPSTNAVEWKWLFRIKHKTDGSVDMYKACLLAKRLTHRPGSDFHSTLSPVVKPITIRLVLTIVMQYNCPIHQTNVNNALLQGRLEEEVYMRHPPGFQDQHLYPYLKVE